MWKIKKNINMLTNKDYCDNDTCVALEELGFPIRRIKVKGKENNVPILLYEAQKFLREEKGIHITINYIRLDEEDIFMYTLRYRSGTQRRCVLYNNQQYSSYEEALSEGIKEAVKNLSIC